MFKRAPRRFKKYKRSCIQSLYPLLMTTTCLQIIILYPEIGSRTEQAKRKLHPHYNTYIEVIQLYCLKKNQVCLRHQIDLKLQLPYWRIHPSCVGSSLGLCLSLTVLCPRCEIVHDWPRLPSPSSVCSPARSLVFRVMSRATIPRVHQCLAQGLWWGRRAWMPTHQATRPRCRKVL